TQAIMVLTRLLWLTHAIMVLTQAIIVLTQAIMVLTQAIMCADQAIMVADPGYYGADPGYYGADPGYYGAGPRLTQAITVLTQAIMVLTQAICYPGIMVRELINECTCEQTFPMKTAGRRKIPVWRCQMLIFVRPSTPTALPASLPFKAELCLSFAVAGGNQQCCAQSVLSNHRAVSSGSIPAVKAHLPDQKSVRIRKRICISSAQSRLALVFKIMPLPPSASSPTGSSNQAPSSASLQQMAIEGRNSALTDTLSRMQPAHITQLLRLSISQRHVALAATLINDERVSTQHVDLPDSTGATALMLAADAGHHELIEKLIDLGASVRAEDSQGRTALSRACEAGHVRAVKALMDRGADASHRDGQGLTCAQVAERFEQRQVLRLLDASRAVSSFSLYCPIVSISEHTRDLHFFIPGSQGCKIFFTSLHCRLCFSFRPFRAKFVASLAHCQRTALSGSLRGRTALSRALSLERLSLAHCQGERLSLLIARERLSLLIARANGSLWLIARGERLSLAHCQANGSLWLIARGERLSLAHCSLWLIARGERLSLAHCKRLSLAHCQERTALSGSLPASKPRGPAGSRSPLGFGLHRLSDDSQQDRRLSEELHRLLSDAGFTEQRAKCQQSLADWLQGVARVLTQDRRQMTGSYAEGWANSLVQVNGRTAADSDIDWTVLVAEQTSIWKVMEGHAQVTAGAGSQPAVTATACGVRPAQDTCHAIQCCSSFCEDRIRKLLPFGADVHLVRATRPSSTNELRVSFSFQEKYIMRRLSTVQGQLFTLIKFIFKRHLPLTLDTPGLKTYHAKTLLFFMLEKHGTDPETDAWQPHNLIALLKESLDRMLSFIDSSSSPDECMPHFFFMPDAPLYFKNAGIGGDFDNTKARVRDRLCELRSDVGGVAEQLRRLVRPLQSEKFYFHMFTLLPLTAPPAVTEIRKGMYSPKCTTNVYSVVHQCVSELQSESSDRDTLMRQLSLLHHLQWCKCAALCMTAMAHLKFGESEEAERLAMELQRHQVEYQLLGDPDLEELLTLAHYSDFHEHVKLSLQQMEMIEKERRVAMETQDEEKIGWVRQKLKRLDEARQSPQNES
uniref:ANK_REP_REGION domain-containing protein n=1 Tax=Macrostomum lignano TaxID=282301 RepID=A0A1I8HF24_9PLAT